MFKLQICLKNKVINEKSKKKAIERERERVRERESQRERELERERVYIEKERGRERKREAEEDGKTWFFSKKKLDTDFTFNSHYSSCVIAKTDKRCDTVLEVEEPSVTFVVKPEDVTVGQHAQDVEVKVKLSRAVNVQWQK